MIKKASDIGASDQFGAKVHALARLKMSGFEVPEFVVVTMRDLREVFSGGEQKISEFEQLLQKSIPWKVSAVRSSIAGEDERFASHAGEFSTELRVPKEGIVSALRTVLEASKGRGGSIIIQQFIEPDISGVCFTHDPTGAWGMRINYVRGHNEQLVSGKIGGRDIVVFTQDDVSTIPLSKKSFDVFKNIQILFQFPQDIEWLVRDGKLFIVQSRPITTLDDAQVAGFCVLDGENFKPGYFFESLGINAGLQEHPVPLMKSIFEMVYGKQGAVHMVYSRMGCNVTNYQNPLIDFSGHLFIDKNREVVNILPTYAYRNSFSNPKPVRFAGFFTGIKNGVKIRKFLMESSQEDMHAIRNHFVTPPPVSIDAWRADFLVRYIDIYRISLRARHAIEILEKIGKEKSIPVREILLLTSSVLEEKNKIAVQTDGWIGNGLDITDTMPFKKNETVELNPKMKEWFLNQNPKTQKMIQEALQVIYCREYTRWSLVQSMQFLRNILYKKFQDAEISSTDFYFVSLDSLIHKKWTKELLVEAKEVYSKEQQIHFPQRISDVHTGKEKSQTFVIADGVLSGMVVLREDLEKDPSLSGCIIVTETLDPKLAGYLDRISGVIAVNGSYLAHFAIIARESNIPTIVLGNGARNYVGQQLNIDIQALVVSQE